MEIKFQHFFHDLSLKFDDFLHKLKEESIETQTAFSLLKEHEINGRILTDEEKNQIGEQLKDVLKTVGLVGLVSLPGGSLFFVLFHFLKVNKYVMPSSFLTEEEKKV